jgi:predicted DNA binding protein
MATAPAKYIHPIPAACMARGLTEVVFQTTLPPGKVHHLTATEPSARIILTPLVLNGVGYPTRFLIATSGFERGPTALRETLATLFDDLNVVHEDAGTTSFVGNLTEIARRALDTTLGEALQGFGRDLVYRPILIKGGWAHVSLVVTEKTPAEEVVHRVARVLAERGITARLVRLEPYHPEHQGLGIYDDALTPKQAEILKMALALGLYDTPRRCTLDDLAGIFGISKAAAHNRMKGAERKILARYFEG